MAQKDDIKTEATNPTGKSDPNHRLDGKPFSMTFLEARVLDCLQVAMGIIARGDGLQPCVLFGRRGVPENPLALDMSSEETKELSAEKCQKAMRMLSPPPEYALTVSDSYIRKVGEKALIECIIISGESILGSFSVAQEYYRSDIPGPKVFFADQTISREPADNIFFGSAWTELRTRRAAK